MRCDAQCITCSGEKALPSLLVGYKVDGLSWRTFYEDPIAVKAEIHNLRPAGRIETPSNDCIGNIFNGQTGGVHANPAATAIFKAMMGIISSDAPNLNSAAQKGIPLPYAQASVILQGASVIVNLHSHKTMYVLNVIPFNPGPIG